MLSRALLLPVRRASLDVPVSCERATHPPEFAAFRCRCDHAVAVLVSRSAAATTSPPPNLRAPSFGRRAAGLGTPRWPSGLGNPALALAYHVPLRRRAGDGPPSPVVHGGSISAHRGLYGDGKRQSLAPDLFICMIWFLSQSNARCYETKEVDC